MIEVFTEEWALACCEEMNRRESYRQAAAEWEAPVVLVMESDPALGVEEDRAFWLDMYRGECRGARRATDADLSRATYVMRAHPSVWQHMLEEGQDPVNAVMTGKLRLVRGNVLSLARYTAAAREMVAAAAAVEAVFPPPRL